MTSAILAKHKISWLVVDHYGLEARWESAIKKAGVRVLAIDDLADRKHAANVLLNQNLGTTATDYTHLLTEPCALLLGANYVMLRPEFAELRSIATLRTWPPRKILISLGGSDSSNVTALVARAIIDNPPQGTQVQILLGPSYRHKSELQPLTAPYPWITLLDSVENPAKLLAEADLAIGAAGTSAWERCCLGLPSIVLSLAANQDKIANTLIRHGAAIDGGRHPNLDPQQITIALAILSNKPELTAEISGQARRLVDGLGVSRVADHLLH